jgi:hypothetical protein
MREHAHRVGGGDVYWTISTLPVALANHTFMAHAHTPGLAFCMVWWGVLWHMLTGSSHLRPLLCTSAQLLYPILRLLAAICRCANHSLLFHMLPPSNSLPWRRSPMNPFGRHVYVHCKFASKCKLKLISNRTGGTTGTPLAGTC